MQEIFITIPYHHAEPRPPEPKRRKRPHLHMPVLICLSLAFGIALRLTAMAYVKPGQEKFVNPPAQRTVASTDEKAHAYKSIEPQPVTQTNEPVSEQQPEDTIESLEVPDVNSAPKRYMDYRAITAPSSIQYALQQDATTDEYGFRRYGDYYMIALGTYYTGYECGKVFRITLDTGVSFEAITGDVKADVHTDSKNQHRDGNIVEFIVDTKKISGMAAAMGDMSYSDGVDFSGKVTKIEKLKE